jgi:predicted enzyme related to lactoylglutathione lyase
MTYGAVVYAKDLGGVARFYEAVCGLPVTSESDEVVTLGSDTFEVAVVKIPEAIAVRIEITSPPVRREDTPVKVVFPVADLDAARIAAARFGGVVDPADHECSRGGWTRCDGHDPEGNVLQVRQRTPS